MCKILVEKTKSISGARVENNKFCLSVHFRCVDEKVRHQFPLFSFLILYWYVFIDLIGGGYNNLHCFSVCNCHVYQSWAVLAEQVRLVLNEYPKLKLTQGRKVSKVSR